MRWLSLPIDSRKCEVKAKLVEPEPPGPYFLVHQHDETKFMKDYLTKLGRGEIEFQDKFEIKWGHATYVPSDNGIPMKVAYWYSADD